MRPKRSSERSNSQKAAVVAAAAASAANEGASPVKKKGRSKGTKAAASEPTTVADVATKSTDRAPPTTDNDGSPIEVIDIPTTDFGSALATTNPTDCLAGASTSDLFLLGGDDSDSERSFRGGDTEGGNFETSDQGGDTEGSNTERSIGRDGSEGSIRGIGSNNSEIDGAVVVSEGAVVVSEGAEVVSEGAEVVSEGAEADEEVATKSGQQKGKGLTLDERDQLAAVLKDFELRKYDTFEITAAEEQVTLERGTKGNNLTRLRSVAKIPINSIRVRLLTKICKELKIDGYSRASLVGMCECIVAAKLNRLQLAVTDSNAGQQIREEMCPQLSGPPAKRNANKLRLVNAIFCNEGNRALYAKFNQQPGKDALTARTPHNQKLFDDLMTTFNDFEGDEGLQMSLHRELVSSVPLTHIVKFEKVDHVKTVHGALHKEYRAVMTNVLKSGNHSDFSHYTDSIPLKYYAQCLAQFPDILASFCPTLPDGVARQSTRKAGSSGGSSVGSTIGNALAKRSNKRSPVEGSANDAVLLLAESIKSSAAASEARSKMQERQHKEKLAMKGEERASKVLRRATVQHRQAQKECRLARTAESDAFKEYTTALKNARNDLSGDDLLQLTAERAESQWKEAGGLLVEAKEAVESAKLEVEIAKHALSLAQVTSAPPTRMPSSRRLSSSFTQTLEASPMASPAVQNSDETPTVAHNSVETSIGTGVSPGDSESP